MFISYFLLCARDKTRNLGGYIEMAECHKVFQSMLPCCCIERLKAVHFTETVLLF